MRNPHEQVIRQARRGEGMSTPHASANSADTAAWTWLTELVRKNREKFALIVGWGDGNGGAIAKLICDELGVNYFSEIPQHYRKLKIPHSLSKRVMERDAYRCVACGAHIDLTCDHVIPESQGGATELENLQTLCRSCNSRKGTRVEAA